MNRFNLGGTIALLVVAAVYLVASLVSGHSAASQPRAELSAKQQALEPLAAAALLVREEVAILDTRPAEQYRTYHLAGALSVPGASSRKLLATLGQRPVALVVAPNDEVAAKLAGELLALDGQRSVHFISGGVRAWYLAFELPIPLFTEQPRPFGYDEAMATVRAFTATGHTDDRKRVLSALERLAHAQYQPTELAGKKPKPAGGAKKKVSGGCG